MTLETILSLTTELVSKLGLDLKATGTQDGDFFCINLAGRDAKYLEGRDNRTGALITILKHMLKQQHGTEPRLVIDLNNQRAQRLENVVAIARKKAEMVRISGMEEEMPPMTPAERRAVHMALKEMVGIATESRGEEPHRRIVIVAKDDE